VNTWGEITIDAARGIAYFPLGSPTYVFTPPMYCHASFGHVS
jgi:hypothetical protein